MSFIKRRNNNATFRYFRDQLKHKVSIFYFNKRETKKYDPGQTWYLSFRTKIQILCEIVVILIFRNTYILAYKKKYFTF